MPDGFIVTAIKSFVLVNLVMVMFAFMTWFERRLIGRFQVRLGPNRVGPFGLLQPIADLGKLIQKESLIPVGSSAFLYLVAPVISLFSALMVFSVVPFGGQATIPGTDYQIYLWIADPERRPAAGVRARLVQLLRVPGGRLVVQLQVLAVRLDARRLPAGQLRGEPCAGRDRRRDDVARRCL